MRQHIAHYFVVVIPRRVNIGDDDWRRCVHRRSRRKNDAGNDRGGISLWPFPPQAAAQYPDNHRQGQPDEHEVTINAVILNQGVQSVEYGIQHRSRI